MDRSGFTRGLAVTAAVVCALGVSCASWRGAQLYQSGSEALERGETERAIADLERASELAPAASEVRNHLGLAYAAAGRREEMLAAFRQAVDLDCDNLSARHNLRSALEGEGGAPPPQPIH
jgi:Flp pilus assembly protein TadD